MFLDTEERCWLVCEDQLESLYKWLTPECFRSTSVTRSPVKDFICLRRKACGNLLQLGQLGQSGELGE